MRRVYPLFADTSLQTILRKRLEALDANSDSRNAKNLVRAKLVCLNNKGTLCHADKTLRWLYNVRERRHFIEVCRTLDPQQSSATCELWISVLCASV